MNERVTLTVDRQRRISVGRLGFEEGYVVAEALADGGGWVLRPARVMTEAEADVLGRSENVLDLQRGLDDVAAGRVVERFKRQ